jgi:hypothetical protein
MFLRSSSVRKFSEKIDENCDDVPSIDHLKIIIFESYDFPKTREEIEEIINKISKNGGMVKGCFRFNFSIKTNDESVILVEKKSNKTIIPLNEWIKIIKQCHIKINKMETNTGILKKL